MAEAVAAAAVGAGGDVDGAANSTMADIDITFKQPGGNSATTRLVFVVIANLRSKLMIGCPTLDALSFAVLDDFVELRPLPKLIRAGSHSCTLP